MTPMPCRVAGCIISIRPTYSSAPLLIYLLTYTVGCGRTKPAISTKHLKISNVTIKVPYKVVLEDWQIKLLDMRCVQLVAY